MMMSTKAERGETIVTKDGQVYLSMGDEHYRAGPRSKGVRRVWRTQCKQCGKSFEFSTPADNKPHFARRYCAAHKDNKTDNLFGVSAVGTVITHDGQRYNCEAVIPMTRRNGEPTLVRQWSSECRACKAPFTFTAGMNYGTPKRNCEAHKRHTTTYSNDVFA